MLLPIKAIPFLFSFSSLFHPPTLRIQTTLKILTPLNLILSSSQPFCLFLLLLALEVLSLQFAFLASAFSSNFLQSFLILHFLILMKTFSFF